MVSIEMDGHVEFYRDHTPALPPSPAPHCPTSTVSEETSIAVAEGKDVETPPMAVETMVFEGPKQMRVADGEVYVEQPSMSMYAGDVDAYNRDVAKVLGIFVVGCLSGYLIVKLSEYFSNSSMYYYDSASSCCDK